MTQEVDIIGEQKKRFALELLKTPRDPYSAAVLVFGDDTASAIVASVRWPTDPEVIGFQEDIKDEHGEMSVLPDKAMTAREIWNLATETANVEDRLKALRLYAELRNFIERPNANAVTVNNNTQKVLVVNSHGSEENWERELIEQQRNLITDANVEVIQP